MALDIVLGIAVLGLLIYRQVSPRRVSATALRMTLILGVIGIIQVTNFLSVDHHGSAVFAALAGSLVLAAGFGAARAATVRLWLRDGEAWTQGNAATALLWVLAVGGHLGYDALVSHGKGESGLGTASLVLYLAVSLAVQRLMVQHRAGRLLAGPAAPGLRSGVG